MMVKIKITGVYKGQNPRGTVIGGIPFVPNTEQKAMIDETTFKMLEVAQKNGWFEMTSNNYDAFLEQRNKNRCGFSCGQNTKQCDTENNCTKDPVVPEPPTEPPTEPVLEPSTSEDTKVKKASSKKSTAKKDKE